MDQFSLTDTPALETGPPQDYLVREVQAPEQLEALRPAWEALNRRPSTQIDFYTLINGLTNPPSTPHVLTLERNGTVEGLVIGRVVVQDFNLRLGYQRVTLGKVRQLNLLHGGILGRAAEDGAAAAVQTLKAKLRERTLDLIFLNFTDTASPFYQAAMGQFGLLQREPFVESQLHWKASLPKSAEEFFQRCNKKHRYWLRRLQKKVAQDFPGKVVVRRVNDARADSQITRDMERVASRTYQRAMGVGFQQNAEHTARLALASEKNWLRAYVLYLGESPRAFWLGSVYKQTFFSEATGYDPDYREYEPGTVLFVKMIESLCAEGVAAFDFGLGDALYKQRFGDQHWREASVRFFAPSPRGRSLHLADALLTGPAFCAKHLLERLKLLQRLKTFWRRRLAGSSRE